MKHPGDLTEEERNTAQDRFLAAAIEAWGKDRAASIELALNETAAAIARLGKLALLERRCAGVLPARDASRLQS